MVLPIDDHGFHRGDGVFEAVKWINGKYWLLEPHLNRLFKSAQGINLRTDYSRESIKDLCEKIKDESNSKNGFLRIYWTRGTGSFSVDPFDCPSSHFYLVTTTLDVPSDKIKKQGVKISKSKLIPKLGFYAQIKSLNYLPNVLMKQEAKLAGFDYMIGTYKNEKNIECVLESSTENIACVIQGKIYSPLFDSTLRGTTLLRAKELVEHDGRYSWSLESFSWEQLRSAEEIFLFNTGMDCLPVGQIEEIKKENHEISQYINTLIQADQK